MVRGGCDNQGHFESKLEIAGAETRDPKRQADNYANARAKIHRWRPADRAREGDIMKTSVRHRVT